MKMKFFDWILDFFFPRRCTFCHRITQDHAEVCLQCRRKLPYSEAAARQSIPGLSACYSPLYYTDSVRRSLLRYKFGGLNLYAAAYGEFLAKCIDENKISCDSITWVPLSRRRLRTRGYDQARLLAEETAKRTGFPCIATLRKKRNNPAQSSTGSAEKRRRNVKGVYEALPEAAIRGKTILLIDDIVTTGATLSECAGVLRRAGASEVIGLTLARRKE